MFKNPLRYLIEIFSKCSSYDCAKLTKTFWSYLNQQISSTICNAKILNNCSGLCFWNIFKKYFWVILDLFELPDSWITWIIWITCLNMERTRSGGDPNYDYNQIPSNSVIFFTLTRTFCVKVTRYGSFEVTMASIKSIWPLKWGKNGQIGSHIMTVLFKVQRSKTFKRIIRNYLKLFLNLLFHHYFLYCWRWRRRLTSRAGIMAFTGVLSQLEHI